MDSGIFQPGSLERAYLDREKVAREMRRRQARLREQQRQMVRRFVDDHQSRLKQLQGRLNDSQQELAAHQEAARRWRWRAWRVLLWGLLALLAGGWLLVQQQRLRQYLGGHQSRVTAAEQRADELQHSLRATREALAEQHWRAAEARRASDDRLLASHHFLQAALSETAPARAANARLAAREMLGDLHLAAALSVNQPVHGGQLLNAGRLLVWGEQGLRLWDPGSGRPLTPPLSQAGPLLGVAADYPRALAWSAREARLWDLARGRSLASLEPLGELHGATLLADGGALTWDAAGDLRWWSSAGELRQRFRHPGAVLGVTLQQELARLLSWSWDPAQDRSLLVMHRLTGKGALLRLPVPGRLTGAALSPGGGYLLGWSGDGRIRLWNAASGELLRLLETQQDWIHGGRFVAGRLLTWSEDGSARLWRPGIDGDLGRRLDHGAAVLGARVAPGGAHLLTWSGDHQARLWDATDGLPLSAPLPHDGALQGAAFQGDEVLTWSEDGSARLWRVADGLSLAPPLHHPAPVVAGGFLDGGQLFSLDRAGGLRLWQRQSRRAPAGGNDPAGVVFAPTADRDGRLDLGAALPDLPGDIRHALWMRGARLDDDAERLLVWGGDLFGGQVAVWDLLSGAPITDVLPQPERVAGAVFHPDGRRFLTWTDGGHLQQWSARGRPLGEPLQPRERILGVRYSLDGEQLLTWHGDGAVRVWDSQRLAALLTTAPVPGGIRRAFFAEADRLVIEPLLGPPSGRRLLAVPDLPDPMASAWLEVASGTGLDNGAGLRILEGGDWLARAEALPVDTTQLAGVEPSLNNSSSNR